MFEVWPMVTLFLYFHQSLNMSPFWFLGTVALAGGIGYMVARFYSEPLNHRLRKKLSEIAPQGSAAAAEFRLSTIEHAAAIWWI
jgi:peptidoglycan/LPS O-acetylase OafA/YrhL